LQHHSLKNCAIISTLRAHTNLFQHKYAVEVENNNYCRDNWVSSSPSRAELKDHISRAKPLFTGAISHCWERLILFADEAKWPFIKAQTACGCWSRGQNTTDPNRSHKGARKQIGASVIAEIISAQRDQIGRRGQARVR
jgi:hypothetical protein